MLDQNKVKDDLPGGFFSQRKSLVLLQKGDRFVIDGASNTIYNRKKRTLYFPFLRKK